MYINYLHVSSSRLGEIIGKKGRHKKELEKLTGTKITVKENGEIEIKGEDSYTILQACKVLQAMDCGFRYSEAINIILKNYIFDEIDLKQLGLPWYHNKRILGRVIGKKGLAKQTVERLTGTWIVVNEEQLRIGILGDSEGVYYAREALLDIIRGSPHGRVFKKLEKIKQQREKDYKALLWRVDNF
ncbi:MAG: hypothetical protein GXO42_01365 [bacterium]|nr:hypothetical protein [bacterium]